MSRVLITGVSAGLGAELMELCLAAGDHVLGVVRRAEQQQALLDPGRPNLRIERADLSRPEEVRALIERLDGEVFEHVVLNAGCADMGAFSELPAGSIDTILQTNLMANLHLSHALIPMALEHGGKLTFVSSVCARLPGIRFASYAVSKAGLTQLANSLRVEYPELQVLCLELGGVATEFHAKAGIHDGRSRRSAQDIAARMHRAMLRDTGVRTLVPSWWLARRILMIAEGSVVAALRWRQRRQA